MRRLALAKVSTRSPALAKLLSRSAAMSRILTRLAMLAKLLSRSSAWSRELEGQKEVGDLLELRPDSVKLVNEVLFAEHALLTQIVCDELVVRQRDALLVEELTNGLHAQNPLWEGLRKSIGQQHSPLRLAPARDITQSLRKSQQHSPLRLAPAHSRKWVENELELPCRTSLDLPSSCKLALAAVA